MKVSTERKSRVWLKSIMMMAVVACLAAPAPTRADAVTDWNLTGVNAVLNSGIHFVRGLIILAYVHAATYDAVNAIDGQHSVYAIKASAAHQGASQEAAAIAAAYNVLKGVFPTQ